MYTTKNSPEWSLLWYSFSLLPSQNFDIRGKNLTGYLTVSKPGDVFNGQESASFKARKRCTGGEQEISDLASFTSSSLHISLFQWHQKVTNIKMCGFCKFYIFCTFCYFLQDQGFHIKKKKKFCLYVFTLQRSFTVKGIALSLT